MARITDKINLPTNTTDIRTLAKYLKYIDKIGLVPSDKEQDVFAQVKINESRKTVTNPARDTHTKSTLKSFGLIDVNNDESFKVSSLGQEVLNWYLNEDAYSKENRVALMLKVLCKWEINDKYGRHMHPGFLLIKLLCDPDLDYYITNHELSHFTMCSKFKSDDQYNEIKNFIIDFRNQKFQLDRECNQSKADIFLSTFDTNWGLLTRESNRKTLTVTELKELNKQWENESLDLSAENSNDEENEIPEENSFTISKCRLNNLAFYVARIYLSLLEGLQIKDYLSFFTSQSTNKSMKPLQKIYYGSPGCGKSHYIKKFFKENNIPEEQIIRTTFHPDSDYNSFVGSYKPIMEGNDIKYKFSPQSFTKAYIKAYSNPSKNFYLIIEEINRGNCAQIFGDIFQLLDRDNSGISIYPIDADEDLRKYLEEELSAKGFEGIKEGKLTLPTNLNIIATMNTSDQSLFPMDSAFKRRWDWEYMPIDMNNPDSAKFVIKLKNSNNEKFIYKWHSFLEQINPLIRDVTKSEDKQLGNFFIKDSIEGKDFISKVMFFLWYEICKDEYGTKNNFFKNQDDVEFTFNDLYSSKGMDLLISFMDKWKVKQTNPEELDGEGEIIDLSKSSTSIE